MIFFFYLKIQTEILSNPLIQRKTDYHSRPFKPTVVKVDNILAGTIRNRFSRKSWKSCAALTLVKLKGQIFHIIVESFKSVYVKNKSHYGSWQKTIPPVDSVELLSSFVHQNSKNWLFFLENVCNQGHTSPLRARVTYCRMYKLWKTKLIFVLILIIQSNLSRQRPPDRRSGRCGEVWPLWGGGGGVIWHFLGGVKHVYCAKFMLTVSHNGNPIMFNIYIEIKYTKNLYNVFNQNVNVIKWARLPTFI